MKKLVLFATFIVLSMVAKAQIKIQQNGQVSLGTFSSSINEGVQVSPLECTYFNSSSTENWSWVTMASPTVSTGKCWIVSYPNKTNHTFFVSGYGYVYKKGSYIASDSNTQADRENIRNAGGLLDRITGFYYTPIPDSSKNYCVEKKQIGLSAEEIMEVVPEIVTSDENGLMYVNYEGLIPILIEGFKAQQKEIEELKSQLLKNPSTK